MANIIGNPVDKARLDDVMQRISTRCHELVSDIESLNSQMAELLDADIESIYLAGGLDAQSSESARTDFRSWLAACKAWADNYSGAGEVLNRKYEIAKRVKPRV